MPIELDDIQRVAATEVHLFIKRAPWSAHHAADMQQEVILALFASRENFDSSKGPWGGFAGATARHVIVRYLKRARVWKGKVGEVALTVDHECVIDGRALPDAQFDDARMAKKVRTLLRRLDYSKKKVGLASALGTPAREVAAAAQVPVKVVYRARERLVLRAALSTPLKQLWKEIRP